MDKQHVKGALDKMKGGVKDVAGQATGNRRLQAEGKTDKAKGSMRSVLGNIKDMVRRGGR